MYMLYLWSQIVTGDKLIAQFINKTRDTFGGKL